VLGDGKTEAEAVNQRKKSTDEAAKDEGCGRVLEQRGRFAVVIPPAMTMLLSVAAKPTEARAAAIPGGRLHAREARKALIRPL
jgi:hypothetical protein